MSTAARWYLGLTVVLVAASVATGTWSVFAFWAGAAWVWFLEEMWRE